MDKKTLLLDAGFQFEAFIDVRKAIKHICKEKVEVICNWNDNIAFFSGSIPYPSVLRLKNHIKKNYFNPNFSRKSILKRDSNVCQYCSRVLPASQITIDHVIPRAQGGTNSFTNCVVACRTCNGIKGSRTPEEARMTLVRKPTVPDFASFKNTYSNYQPWNPEWDDFLNR